MLQTEVRRYCASMAFKKTRLRAGNRAQAISAETPLAFCCD